MSGRALVAGVAAAGLLALAGCGGGTPKPSGVASLSGPNASGGGRTTTTVSGQNVAQLYHQWADCIRQHGIEITDPVIDNQGVVNINLPQGFSKETYDTAQQACTSLHQAAQNAARGSSAADKPDTTKMLNFSKCMRAHGLPDFPDPSSGGIQIKSGPGSDLSPDSPTFQAAQKACQHIIGSMKGGEKVTASEGGGPGGPGGAKAGG